MYLYSRLHVIAGVVTILDAIDCVWEAWGPWQACALSCGDEQITRMRTVDTEAEFGGKNCSGNSTEVQDCKNDACLGT